MSGRRPRGKPVAVALIAAIVVIWAAVMVVVWVSRRPGGPVPPATPATSVPAPEATPSQPAPSEGSGEVLTS